MGFHMDFNEEQANRMTCGVAVFDRKTLQILYSNAAFSALLPGDHMDLDEDRHKKLEEILASPGGSGRMSLPCDRDHDESKELTMFLVGQTDGKVFSLLFDDIEQSERMRRLEERALIDPLTKVYNRETAIEKITENLAHLKEGEQGAFLVLDIDNFKKLNDTYGHVYGDAVIATVAGSIHSILEPGEVIGRFGGDEFLIYLRSDVGNALDRKLDNIRMAVLACGVEKTGEQLISCSIGVSLASGKRCYGEMFKEADSALYMAKKNGKNRHEFYDGEIHGGSITYAQSEPEDLPEGTGQHSFAELAMEIVSRANTTESAIVSLLHHSAVALGLDRMEIFRYDLKQDRVNVEFAYHREKNGQYNYIDTVRKTGYYNHSDLVIFREELLKTGYIVYTPEFKERFSFKYKTVLGSSDHLAVFYSSTVAGQDDSFLVISSMHKNPKRIWRKAERETIMDMTRFICMYVNTAFVESEREKALERALTHTVSGAYTIEPFFERNARISTKALYQNCALAMVHYHMSGMEEVMFTYGKEAMEALADDFVRYLIESKGDERLVAQYNTKEDAMILCLCKDEETLQAELLQEIRTFCATREEYKDPGFYIQACMCKYVPGDIVRNPFFLSQMYNRNHTAGENHIYSVPYRELKE